MTYLIIYLTYFLWQNSTCERGT